MSMMKSVLTIAGSDTSGGAGIQADLKTMSALGVFGQSAITALTAQNTMGVTGVVAVEPEFLTQQMDAVFDDIVPDAVKIGMISSPELVKTIAAELKQRQVEHVVLDPVMVATSGAELSGNEAVKAMVEDLIPCAEILTPNIPEAEALLSFIDEEAMGAMPEDIETEEDMMIAAGAIQTLGCKNVLIKGGHAIHDANDFLLTEKGECFWLRSERINTNNTHGTGCTLSSAIACFLAQGNWPLVAVSKAKAYLTGALMHDPELGKGNGPLNHMWANGLSRVDFARKMAELVSIEKVD